MSGRPKLMKTKSRCDHAISDPSSIHSFQAIPGYQFNSNRLQVLQHKAKLEPDEMKKLGTNELSKLMTFSQPKAFLQFQKVSERDWAYLLMYSSLEWLPYETFSFIIQKPEVKNKIATYLQEKYGIFCSSTEKKFSRGEIDRVLTEVDKELFLKFRDQKITFDQVKARNAERLGIAKYKILDDLKEDMNPEFLENRENNL